MTGQRLTMRRWQEQTGWIVGRRINGDPARTLTGRPHPDPRRRGQHSSSVGRVWDHVHRLDRPGGRRAIITQPYDWGPDKAAELDAWCAPIGAAWAIPADPWWHEWTVAVVVERARDGAA